MRELKGEADLQLAKDVLCAFEEAHYPNRQACGDIQEYLYWHESEDCYWDMDAGQLLRGECEEVRIFEFDKEDDWLTPLEDLPGWVVSAFVSFKEKLYFFCI